MKTEKHENNELYDYNCAFPCDHPLRRYLGLWALGGVREKRVSGGDFDRGGRGGGRGVRTMNRRPGGVKITPKNPSLSCAPRAPRGPPRGDFGALPPGALSKSGVRTCFGDSPSRR